MIRKLFYVGLLSLLCFGCVPMEAQQEAVSGTEAAAIEKEAAKSSCDAVLDELVAKSRNTMKTAKGTCEGKRYEVNPMWAIDYDGTVRIRVYDADGNKVGDELRKPAPQQ